MQFLQFLPDDILNIIFNYIKPHHKIFINKYYYIKYNYLIDDYIYRYESYVRDIIRYNANFVFERMLERNFIKWITPTHYTYNNNIYNNYISFLLAFAQDNQAFKCLEIINLKLIESKLKNVCCKNTRTKNKKWIF